MPDQFADALERLEVTFENVGPDEDIFGLLHTVLGRMPTPLQADLGTAKLQQERVSFLLEGFTIQQIIRRGQLVTILRDARGRFVRTGRENINRFIDAL